MYNQISHQHSAYLDVTLPSLIQFYTRTGTLKTLQVSHPLPPWYIKTSKRHSWTPKLTWTLSLGVGLTNPKED